MKYGRQVVGKDGTFVTQDEPERRTRSSHSKGHHHRRRETSYASGNEDRSIDLSAAATQKYTGKHSIISPVAIDLTMRMEGLSFQNYRCPTGYGTIGFGTPCGKKMNITGDQATNLLHATFVQKEELAHQKFGSAIDKLRPNEKDGVMDLVYNLKPSAIKGGLVRAVENLARFSPSDNSEARKQAVEQLARTVESYNRGGGQRMGGLASRRHADSLLIQGKYEELQSFIKSWKGDGIDVLRNGVPSGRQISSPVPNYRNYYQGRGRFSDVEINVDEQGVPQRQDQQLAAVDPRNLPSVDDSIARTPTEVAEIQSGSVSMRDLPNVRGNQNQIT